MAVVRHPAQRSVHCGGQHALHQAEAGRRNIRRGAQGCRPERRVGQPSKKSPQHAATEALGEGEEAGLGSHPELREEHAGAAVRTMGMAV